MSNNRFVSSLKSLAGTLLGAGLIAAAPMVVSSCVHNDPNAERSEFIDVYANLDQEEPATTYSVGVEGGEFRLYVKSNVEFSAQWQDDASTPWATVESVTKEDDNTSVVTLNVSPRSTYAYYTMRTGTLMLMAPELSLGTYVTINQGLYARLSSDFAWSKYGTADPRKDDGTPFSEWSQTNIGRGWTSTKIEGTKGPFFYGKNGAGKSTIARTIRGNLPGSVEWQSDRPADSYDVLVYDADFIRDNFENYDNLPGVFTVAEENIAVQKQVKEKNDERKKLLEQHGACKGDLDAKSAAKEQALADYQQACWERTKELRGIFDAAVTGKKRPQLFATEILSTTPVDHDYDELVTLYQTVYQGSGESYPLFNKAGRVTYATLPGFELMGKPIFSSSETPFSSFITALNATDWVRHGHASFGGRTDGKCPYCQQKLPANFEQEIAKCFDTNYTEDITAITEFQTVYEREMTGILETLKKNMDKVLPDLQLEEYQTKLQLLSNAITINLQRIAAKIKEPTTIASLEDTDTLLIELGSIIDEFNKRIQTNNDVVGHLRTEKVKCKQHVWEYLAFYLKDVVAEYHSKTAALDGEISALKTKLDGIVAEGRKIAAEISDLNKQVVNTEATIAGINALLHDSGFQGFSLRAKEGVQNVYEVIRPDGTIADKLSEGERNFIAFLYFYHLVRGSQRSDALKDKIVVIDDPVSSMDSGALFIVSALVREMVEVCYNNTDYQGHVVEGDYIKQIFILTHNVYFHREITYHQVQRYRSVSFFIIRKTDNISSVTRCTRRSAVPSQLENYNPVQNSYAALWDELKEVTSPITAMNVIRRILEYYFLQLCGYEGTNIRKEVLEKEENRKRFIDQTEGGQPDYTRYHLASSMLSYINNSTGITDGLNYVEDCVDAEQYKTVLRLIFEAMHQEQHYNMMMGIDA